MVPSPSQPSVSKSRRLPSRLVALLVLFVCVLLVATIIAVPLYQSLASAFTPPARGSAIITATDVPTGTPTPPVPFAFLDKALKTTTDLRGYYAFTQTEVYADGTIASVIVELPSPPTLADAQWDAYIIQRLAWTTPDTQPHTGWEIAVSFHVPDGNSYWGTHVGMADLKAASAAHLAWTQLTPEQAWQRYDGTLFDPHGLHP